MALSSRAANSITNFGLVHTSLGQATVDDEAVYVTTNRGDGVSIFLGESDSGLFVTPGVYNDPEPSDYLYAEVYGQLNGMTNQRLAIVQGWNEGWAEYGASVDLDALGGSSMTLIAFAGDGSSAR